jgi:4-azaleucine resistance transporter AzlC
MIAQMRGVRAIFAIAWLGPHRNVPRVSAVSSVPVRDGAEALPQVLRDRRAIARTAAGIGAYAAMFGVSFGALSVGSGLTVIQTMVLSAVMFTGASQFALAGIIGGGGSALAGVSAALLLGLRNAFYGIPVGRTLRPRGLRRLWTAHFVIDETVAMAAAQATPRARRYAFWATGLTLFALWNLGSLTGSLVGRAINPSSLGLDAAGPAIFLALLWPQLSQPRARAVALGAAAVALALVPLVPAGIPIVAAAGVAIAFGLSSGRARPGADDR